VYFVENNPIRYNDPTGHDVGCGGRDDSQCVSYGKLDPNIIKMQIMETNNRLAASAREGNISDLEGLRQLANYAASFTPNNPSEFVKNLGAVLTGHDLGNAAVGEVAIQLSGLITKQIMKQLPGGTDHVSSTSEGYSPYYLEIRGKTELMQDGYATIFQDPGAGKNQAHHYWFYVQVGYESGPLVGVIGDALHETIAANSSAGKSYQDYALGVEGSALGFLLKQGTISPNDVGDYIFQTLSPGSENAYLWENYPPGSHFTFPYP
jgi:hypothetical protein